MPEPRPTPFGLVFGATVSDRFPLVRAGIEAAGRDPRERDGFLLVREVAELLRELQPEAGGAGAIDAMVAFVHHAYLFWMDGARVRTVSAEELAMLLGTSAHRDVGRNPASATTLPTDRLADLPTYYVQLPALRVWGTPVAGAPVEPLDGWFASHSGNRLSVLAIFGLNAARAGLTAVEVSGPRPAAVERIDGSVPFAPTLTGGATAGLASVIDAAELLELAWRAAEAL